MKVCTLSSFACLLFLTTSFTLVAAQASYNISDLGTLGSGGYSVSRGVNVAGQVTGATGAGASSEVFFYANGSMTNLGTLGGTSGIGNAINTSGQVAGYSQNASGTYRAFLSSGSNLLDIGDLGGGSAVGYAINDLGHVVGSAVTTNGENHPFLYRNGRMIDLGTLGSSGNDWWNVALRHQQCRGSHGHVLRRSGKLLRLRLEKRKDDQDGNLGRPMEPGLRH